MFLDSEALDLVLQSVDGTGEVASLVRVDRRSNDGAADTACSAESHLGRDVDVRHVLVLCRDISRTVRLYADGGSVNEPARSGKCKIIARGEASAARIDNVSKRTRREKGRSCNIPSTAISQTPRLRALVTIAGVSQLNNSRAGGRRLRIPSLAPFLDCLT